MDHDRDLIRDEVADCVRTSRGDVLENRVRQLERQVTLLVGGLTLAAVLAGIVVTVLVKYG
jgi:glycine cleavage system regulatory protein